jgi:signal transduction histidine kinase/DICT domain-containing protein
MINSQSVLGELLEKMPQLRSHLYFKASLTALAHAVEDRVLTSNDRMLTIACFGQEIFSRQESHRYQRLAETSDDIYLLCAPDNQIHTEKGNYTAINFPPADALNGEWHLVAIGARFAACFICREKDLPSAESSVMPEIDASRRFEGIWTFDRSIAIAAAKILLDRIVGYRPDLEPKVTTAQKKFLVTTAKAAAKPGPDTAASAEAFVERLVTYIQARQYKLLKAYRSIQEKESRERLVNSIAVAIRSSLDSKEILQVAVEELGKATKVSRCTIYQCQISDNFATIAHEYLAHPLVPTILGKTWDLASNPLFHEAIKRREAVYLADVDLTKSQQTTLKKQGIIDCLIVPILHQDRILGMVELHQHQADALPWASDTVSLVEAIATQIGSMLMQAEAYANLEYLNQQLAALDRTRANLVAITGHELRTPLSTIQVCLESLATEPDMPAEMRQIMLNTALDDAERMRKLVQDFLTLSQLESGRLQWHPEPISLSECVNLALSGLNSVTSSRPLPQIKIDLPAKLPFVSADGEWMVEVLTKLLDNACKFTANAKGQVTITARSYDRTNLEVVVADTGRGIEPELLQTVFERFYQAEGALRRTTGGTGLGLAICRQIVTNWGGEIWAESRGKDSGAAFHFTVPVVLSGK